MSNQRYVMDYHANVLLYYGQGWVHGDGKLEYMKEGARQYKAGDKVTVTVNLETGQVTWLLNGQEGISHRMERLKNKSIRWVPMIAMRSKGDIVEILE